MSLATGYDSRLCILHCLNAKLTRRMKAISLKPAGTAINFRIFAVISQFLTNFTLPIAVISMAVALVSSALEVYSVAIPAAFIALGAVYYESEAKKGGAE